MRYIAFAAILLAAPAVAAPHARTGHHTAAPATTVKSQPAFAATPPNFDAILGLMDKLFPPQPDPEPARLAMARTSVAPMWPDGTYAKLTTDLLGGMIDRAMQLKTSDLAAMSGKAQKVSASDTDLSLHDMAAGKDPYFDKRMAAFRDVAGEELGKISAIIDPRIRDGLARSMARRFDAQQLADISAFFATPSGRALAGQYMQLWFDPDMMRSLFGSMPDMMKLMPDMMEKFKAANDKFPKEAEPAKTAKQ